MCIFEILKKNLTQIFKPGMYFETIFCNVISNPVQTKKSNFNYFFCQFPIRIYIRRKKKHFNFGSWFKIKIIFKQKEYQHLDSISSLISIWKIQTFLKRDGFDNFFLISRTLQRILPVALLSFETLSLRRPTKSQMHSDTN